MTAHRTRHFRTSLQKFGWFDGPGLEKTGQEMAMLGFHPARRYALQAALVEVLSGVLVALGLFTLLASTLVASMMFVAAVSALADKGFFLPGADLNTPSSSAWPD